MIIIAGSEIKPDSFASRYELTAAQRKILDAISTAASPSRYSDEGELRFELEMRENIVGAARSLYRSMMSFEIFRESICNTEFWTRTQEGGFMLKPGASPSDAILDIFIRGRKYGTECATAMVIVFYKALLDSYGPELFDRTCRSIYLMNWQNAEHLGVTTDRDPGGYYAGDCRYFANPDVDPVTPEWQGENTIDLGNGQYYGHGIGIAAQNVIIEVLNENRISGSRVPAHLLDMATRPDFSNLYARTLR